MSIGMDAYCYQCLLSRYLETALSLGDAKKAGEFAKELMRQFLDAPESACAPWFGPAATELFTRYYGLSEDRYREEKETSNRFVLERLDRIRARAEQAEDPVYAGMQGAILGNYIDFSALQGQVSFEMLDQMLDKAADMEPDRETYARLCRELEEGRRLLYVTDNAGEIGFDRVFAEILQKRYPHLSITFCVRGGPAANDATREDAEAVGIPFPVIDNGSCVAGTVPELLSDEAKQAMEQADVIIAKGQANVETMAGCGYNVYYLFLIKCARFMELFGKPKMTPMLLRERDSGIVAVS